MAHEELFWELVTLFSIEIGFCLHLYLLVQSIFIFSFFLLLFYHSCITSTFYLVRFDSFSLFTFNNLHFSLLFNSSFLYSIYSLYFLSFTLPSHPSLTLSIPLTSSCTLPPSFPHLSLHISSVPSLTHLFNLFPLPCTSRSCLLHYLISFLRSIQTLALFSPPNFYLFLQRVPS